MGDGDCRTKEGKDADVEPDETAPLTGEEIAALRKLMRDAAQVLGTCPIAIRALSKR
jgi:hypothetical protein